MSVYANGYHPTLNLRVFILQSGRGLQPDVTVLQQEWVSDYQGFPAVWRDVPYYYPAKDEVKPSPHGVLR